MKIDPIDARGMLIIGKLTQGKIARPRPAYCMMEKTT